MVKDTPKHIDQFLKREDAHVEDVSKFSEQEWLGLDEPKYEIVSPNQSAKFPRIIKYIYEQKNIEDAAGNILPYFDLNSGVYEEYSKPQGLFASMPGQESGRKSALEFALLHLVGGI